MHKKIDIEALCNKSLPFIDCTTIIKVINNQEVLKAMCNQVNKA